jgi:hypothetical protein
MTGPLEYSAGETEGYGESQPKHIEYCDIWYGPNHSEKKGILRAIQVPRLSKCSRKVF